MAKKNQENSGNGAGDKQQTFRPHLTFSKGTEDPGCGELPHPRDEGMPPSSLTVAWPQLVPPLCAHPCPPIGLPLFALGWSISLDRFL